MRDKDTIEIVDKPIKPNYWICGGGDLNCDKWDDINGCWNDCIEFGDTNCIRPDIPDNDEVND